MKGTTLVLQPNKLMAHTHTDCRSEAGVTVGLIDGMIAMARVIAKRDHSAPEVLEALKDLRRDEDIAIVLAAPTTTGEGERHD